VTPPAAAKRPWCRRRRNPAARAGDTTSDLRVVLGRDGGGWHASLPDVPGCRTWGTSIDAVLAMLVLEATHPHDGIAAEPLRLTSLLAASMR